MLMTTGFSTTDGLHYSVDTTKKIYSGILMGLEDQDPNALSADPDSVLSKAELNQKKALQKEIIAQNKYIPPVKETTETTGTTGTTAVSANKTDTTAATTVENKDTENAAAEQKTQETSEEDELARRAAENGMTEQEFLDYLYGNTKKEEGEAEGQQEEERHEEESSEEEED